MEVPRKMITPESLVVRAFYRYETKVETQEERKEDLFLRVSSSFEIEFSLFSIDCSQFIIISLLYLEICIL